MNIPEKWCIKNCQEVGEWFNSRTDSKTYTGNHHLTYSYLCSHNDINEEISKVVSRLSFAERGIKTGFTEITIEQFREYVSKTSTPVQQNYKYLTKLLKTLKIK